MKKISNYPIEHDHKFRYDVAITLKKQLLNKYGSDILAIAIYGSVGRGEDINYSDLDMLMVTKDGSKVPALFNMYQGLKFGVRSSTHSQSINVLSTPNLSWSLHLPAYLKHQSIYDPDQTFNNLKIVIEETKKQNFSQAIIDSFHDDLYEQICKLIICHEIQRDTAFRFHAARLIHRMTGFLGLINKVPMHTSTEGISKVKLLPIKFKSYNLLLDSLVGTDSLDLEKCYKLSRLMLEEILAYLESLGLPYDHSDIRIY